jgi:hypothetical protein
MKKFLLTMLFAIPTISMSNPCDRLLPDATPKIPLNETSCFIDFGFEDQVLNFEIAEIVDGVYSLYQAGDQTVIVGDYLSFSVPGDDGLQPQVAATIAAIGIGVARCAGSPLCRSGVVEGVKWGFNAYAGYRMGKWFERWEL